MRGHYGQTTWAQPVSCQVVALSFEYVLLLNQIYLTNSVPFDNTTPIYLINLLWKLGFGLGLDLELHYFRIFPGE